MPERTSYEPGTPSWVDLQSSDAASAKAFYGAVLGWEARDAGPETGGYAFFLKDGRQVAGVVPSPNGPSTWSTYVATGDADALAERATANGAQVVAGPMDIEDAGRMVFLSHPAAGFIGGWQAGRHTGAELVNEPGSMTWNELHTHDMDGAKAFGEAVFGWTSTDAPMGDMPYTIFNVGEDGVAGGSGMPPGVPDEAPAHWSVVFAVEDCDAAVERVREAGGAVLAEPMDLPEIGRFAAVADPQGAQFGVIRDTSRD